MPYLVVSEKDPLSINSLDEVLEEIETSLYKLRILSSQTDFDDESQRQCYRDNIEKLKRFYERAERIALDG